MIKLSDNNEELSEINITPFIDIMLVLLIVFMAVAPLITSSIPIELPKSSNLKVDKDKKLIVFLSENEFFINNEKIDFKNLSSMLYKLKANKDEVIYFHIDKKVNYEKIVEVINEFKNLGYEKIAFSTELTKG